MTMKTCVGLALVLMTAFCFTSTVYAERGEDSNRLSKNGKTEGEIDGVAIVIEYGMPNVKGRTIWGGLIPYGKVWRTGADEASTVEFKSDVNIEASSLAAGKYAIFTIPNESEWTVVFNRVADQWGAFNYDEGEDALRVTVEPGTAEHTESMAFTIDGSNIVLRWEEIAVPISVSAK